MTERTLTDLIEGADVLVRKGGEVTVSGISYRSETTRPGDAFFCVSGLQHDGHDFAAAAVARGAVAVFGERELPLSVPQVVVTDTRRAMALVAARFHEEPSSKLDVVGITGTNGKTTTTYLLDSIFRAAGRVTGIIGTVETRIAGERIHAERTTPEAADLHALLARMVDAGVNAVSMEVSSHAIDLHRVDGVRFAAAAFTNLTQDHLDYHATLDEYWSVKKRLFNDFEVATHVVNVDDPRGAELAGEIAGAWTVGRSADASVRAVDEDPGPVSTAFTLVTPNGSARIVLPLVGAYNVSNALVAAGIALALGIGLTDVAAGLEAAPQVPGRLERVDAGQDFAVFVDYAHTPDSLTKAIAAVRAVTAGRLITVFGCGGDRDPSKRALMGMDAGEGSDAVIITSDNPRTEDPGAIARAIEAGLRSTGAPYTVQLDRRSAIRAAIESASSGDAVLIAGKGHEDYQIFADQTIRFDDREVAFEELNRTC